MRKILLFTVMFSGVVQSFMTSAQTGPNSPTLGTNVTGVGTLAWTNPDRIYTSNDLWATEATRGTTNYLVGTGCGFAIPVPSAIDGIGLDIERNSSAPSNVAILDTWSTGTTKTITAGTNRYLVVIFANENGQGSRDITGMTYGGQAMIQISEFAAGTAGAFIGRIEAWGIGEAGIAAAGSTNIVATYGPFSSLDYCEIFSSCSFQNVDQAQPFNSVTEGGASDATDPHQPPAPITTILGGMAINGVTCGNLGTYTINSAYTAGTDAQFAAGTGSGATIQTAHKASAASGTEQPSCDFSGVVNRWMIVGFHLQRARNLDNQVRVVKSGTITGNNLAATTTAWPTTDAYATYGGAANLWGTTWAVADINSANFGAALSAIVQNGTARVDHFRITVWYHSTLPIELLDFTAEKQGNGVDIKWVTASETNNDYFIVQRSSDGITFENVTIIDGAGNSTSMLYYGIRDEHPYNGTSYYRLKQVDFNGTFEYSPARAVTFDETTVLVYPNPTANGNITIYNNNQQVNEVAVYSADMKLVKTNKYYRETNPIVNIEDVADGTYFLVIKLANETRVVKAFKSSAVK